MKNCIIAIDNEIKEHYERFISNVKNIDSLQFESNVEELCENIVAILDYYIEPIFNNGKMVVDKKLGLLAKKGNFTDIENDYIEDYKINNLGNFSYTLKTAIIGCYEYRESDKELYEQMSEIIIDKCIKLFKYAQLSEYKNQNITKVNIISDDKISCPVCQTMSKFTHDVDKLINKLDDLHSFCKLTIEPFNNFNCVNFTVDKTSIGFLDLPVHLQGSTKSLITQLRIYCKDKIKEKSFIIIDQIDNEADFVELLQNKYDDDKILELQDQIKNTIGLFEIDNKVYISKEHLNKIDYIIVKSLLSENLMVTDLTWWKEQYYKKQKSKYIGDDVAMYSNPFISYIAEQSYELYFLESAIYYILSPKLLKDIDGDNYEKLKHEVFNNIEFIRS